MSNGNPNLLIDPASLESTATETVPQPSGKFLKKLGLGDLSGLLEQAISGGLTSEGFPEDVLLKLENRVRANLKGREMEELRRVTDSFAGRNISGSGPSVRAFERVQRGTSGDMAQAFAQIALENAKAAERFQARGQESTLDLIRSSIAKRLGMGDLRLRKRQLELQRQIQQFLLNMGLMGGFFGAGSGSDSFSLGSIPGLLQGGGDTSGGSSSAGGSSIVA